MDAFTHHGPLFPPWAGNGLYLPTAYLQPSYPSWHAAAPGSLPGQESPARQPTEAPGIPPTEDLMREHGVLNRVLLIYEEGIRRIHTGEDLPPGEWHRAARIIRDFIQDYHERLEEGWVFPRFERAGQLVDLVRVLKLQHDRGRLVTDSILRLTAGAEVNRPENRMRLAQAAALFVRMYRPHEAREDTVLFPQLRKIVTPSEFDALGETFEQEERSRFGEEGFERVVEAVADIEKRLGIYDLAQFTP